MKGSNSLKAAKFYGKLHWRPFVTTIIAGVAVAALADAFENFGVTKGVVSMLGFINDAGLGEQFVDYMTDNYPELCKKI